MPKLSEMGGEAVSELMDGIINNKEFDIIP
jgi:hypothetical protein